MEDTKFSGTILKYDDEQRMFYGWASVVTNKGELVVDRQGDAIDLKGLERAVNKFMLDVRVGKVMHEGEQKITFVHSFPVTDEICKALGLECEKQGWIVGGYVSDDATWQMVKSGKLPALSIGGRAIREKMET